MSYWFVDPLSVQCLLKCIYITLLLLCYVVMRVSDNNHMLIFRDSMYQEINRCVLSFRALQYRMHAAGLRCSPIVGCCIRRVSDSADRSALPCLNDSGAVPPVCCVL